MSTATLTPEAALARVPGWRVQDAAVRRLTDGLTNRTFRVGYAGRRYALRLDAAHTVSFGLDRETELRVLERASDAGIAPPIVFHDAGILLTEWLPGVPWSKSDLGLTPNLEALATLLHKVHALPASGANFDAPAIAARYADGLDTQGGKPATLERCRATVAEATATTTCCCHNDIVAGNIIAGRLLRLIDWEYACDNHPLFDLASLIGFHDLDDATAMTLLSAYDGGLGRLDELRSQLRRYDALQWLWLANRQRVSPSAEQAARLDRLAQRV